MPRFLSTGDATRVELQQAFGRLTPFSSHEFAVSVGKFDSVFGIEYLENEANLRTGITPSLIARYTTGTPLGVKARAKLFKGDFLTLAVAFTNGSSTTEQFHFYDEIDSNVAAQHGSRHEHPQAVATLTMRTPDGTVLNGRGSFESMVLGRHAPTGLSSMFDVP